MMLWAQRHWAASEVTNYSCLHQVFLLPESAYPVPSEWPQIYTGLSPLLALIQSKTWSASYVMPRSDGVPTESPQPEKEECQRQPVNGSNHNRSCHVSICSPTSVPSFPLQLWQGDRRGPGSVPVLLLLTDTPEAPVALYAHQTDNQQKKGSKAHTRTSNTCLASACPQV